jgi:flagellar protein FliL
MSEEKDNNKSNNFLKIIIVVFLEIVLIFGAGFATYFFFLKDKLSTSPTYTVSKTAGAVAYCSNSFLVNLSDPDITKYLKTTIVLSYDNTNKLLAKELAANNYVIKDAIIGVIKSKKSTDLTPKGTEDLKDELLTRVNSVLQSGKIINVYYDDLLIQ